MSQLMNKFLLQDQVGVITGGAGLLGKQHAIALLEAKAKVALLDISQERLDYVKNELSETYGAENISIHVCDITKEENILQVQSEIKSKFGMHPTVLINNAAIDPKADNSQTDKNFSRLENFSLDQWNLEMSVGISGAFLCAKIFGYEMAKSGKGSILNISSDLGVIAPDQRLYKKDGVEDEQQNVKPVTYSVIKHGLIGLTKYIATYWADKGVRCNAMAPAGVFNNHPQDFTDKLSQLIPMKRMAHIDEYQATVLYMCSDASSYMNGTTLVLDGGRSIW